MARRVATRIWIRRVVLVLALLVIIAAGLQVWNVSRQVARLWDYVLNPPAPQADAEVAALRAQLQVMRQYDQRLLETVYWALAVIVVIAALLVGFGWYANFRVYERDKAVLQQDLNNSIQTAMAEARQALLAEVGKASEQVVAKVSNQLSARIESVARDVRSMKYKDEVDEARSWEKAGILGNALITYITAAEYAVHGTAGPLDLENALDNIVRLLEAGLTVGSYHHTRLKPLLDRLPAAYADVVKKIRSLAGIPT